VHHEVFGEMRPVATMVEVSALIAPQLLVEVEADAYVTGAPGNRTGWYRPSGPGRYWVTATTARSGRGP
jgi:hypothetical protein